LQQRGEAVSEAVAIACPTDAGVTDFRECLRLLRDGNPEDGLTRVRRALELEPQNPFYLSYAGLLTAIAERKYSIAESLCKEAVKLKRNHPQPYLNLAEVYVCAGRNADAVETLRKGLRSAGRDVRIRHALAKMRMRRNPVLNFLHRDHPLNRLFGAWRHRILGPVKNK